MLHRSIFMAASLLCLTGVVPSEAGQTTAFEPLAIENIMQGSRWIGTSPSRVCWSEDGSEIYFNWNPDGDEESSLYAVDRTGGEPRAVTDDERRAMPSQGGDYNRSRSMKIFTKNGDIFLLDIKSNDTRQITNTIESEYDPTFIGNDQTFTYCCGDDLFMYDLDNSSLTQLTNFREDEADDSDHNSDNKIQAWLRTEELNLFETRRTRNEQQERKKKSREAVRPDRPMRIVTGGDEVADVQLSPDRRFVTFRLDCHPNDPGRTIIPDYVTETGYTETGRARSKVGSPESTYRFGIYDRQRDTVYYPTTENIPGIYEQPAYLAEYEPTATDEPPSARPVIIYGPTYSDDGSRAAVEVRSQDNKDRWLMTLDLTTGDLSLVDRQRDEAWIGGPGIDRWRGSGGLGWLPDNRRLWFQSEATGYSHLYTVDVVSGQKQQLTDGDFEVHSLTLSHDRKHWYFVSNEIHPGERQFYRMVTGGEREQITSRPGGVRVYLSPDQERIAFLYSTANQPWELFVQNNRPNAEAKQVTHSLSEAYEAYPWRDPEIVTFAARDSATVHARIYHPADSVSHGPAVVFVHGAGYTQNVCNRWTWYYHEMMFHNFLADRGYTVLDIDYRGSAGYGRDCRTGIYRHMGGKDLTDQVDGVRFLVDRYGVDPERVGIYGGSYGGFMALMAMFVEPETFAAGAGLRSVTDWGHYNQGYTSNILNLPYTDSLAYVRSSPIYFAEGLEGALLMCHGMLDDNVHFQDVVRLSQRLIELGKDNWELAVYPMERHTFREPESWIDEYKRIFKLFEDNLK